MKTVIEMAEACGIPEFENNESQADNIMRFHTLIRNATLDEIANKIEAMTFGDTAASFAVWIREQKTKTCPPCHGDCNQGRACPARGSHA